MAAAPTVETILAQLFIAFGQGAGTLTVSHEAIAAARILYAEQIEKVENIENKWDTFALQSLEFARAIGRLAGLNAVQDGRNVISEADWKNAAKKVEDAAYKLKTAALFCPICMNMPFPRPVGV